MARPSAPRSPDPIHSPATPPMFTKLVASDPRREGRSGALASLTSLAIHGALGGLLVWVTMNGGQAELPPPEVPVVIFDIPEKLPPAPLPAAPDVADPTTTTEVDGPLGTPDLPTPIDIPIGIPAPDPGTVFDPSTIIGDGPVGRPNGTTDSVVTSADISRGPIFVPMTVRPAIRNAAEVQRALERYYPPILRDAGIGGTVVVWILIDDEGNVVRTQVHASSGNPALDDAALRIGEVAEFTPAMNRDRRVPVWIQVPLEFEPK